MSEFWCENRHISKAGLYCSICGGRITHIDGKSARQILLEEESEDIEDEVAAHDGME